MSNFLKVDIHTHIIPEHLPDFNKRFKQKDYVSLDHHKPCCAKMILNGKSFREIKSNCWDPIERMRECDTHGVHVQVLSVIPILFNYWAIAQDALETSKYLNDFVAQTVSEHPNRFIGLGTLPMQDPNLAIAELERCVKGLKLPGVQIGSHINDWNLSAEELFPVFEAAEELGAAIFIHPWDMMAKEKMSKYWLPWLVGMPAETSLAICSMIFGGVFERLPNLRVAFAHGGGSFPGTIARIEHGYNCRPDLVAKDNPHNPREYLGKFYLDSLVHDSTMLNYIIDLVGADKIALGTDYPFPLGEQLPGKLIESMSLSDTVKAQLLGESALNWLNIPKEQFAAAHLKTA
ncbi:MAG: amidohydrolase [Bacteroidia bacterium]|nr:amidohydrolase [Bacteroidia bacterium]